jgi:hypothetical protein
MRGVEVEKRENGTWWIRMPRTIEERAELPEFFGRRNYMPLGTTEQGLDNRTRVELGEAEVVWREARSGGRWVIVVPIETWGAERPEVGHVVVLMGEGGLWRELVEWIRRNVRNVR